MRSQTLLLGLLCALTSKVSALNPTQSPTTYDNHENKYIFDMLSMGALVFMLIILFVSFVGGCIMTKKRGRNGFAALFDYLQGVDEEFSDIDSTISGDSSRSFRSVDLSSDPSLSEWERVNSLTSPLAVVESTKICLELYERLFGDLKVPIVSQFYFKILNIHYIWCCPVMDMSFILLLLL